jgi:hypothetical protein
VDVHAEDGRNKKKYLKNPLVFLPEAHSHRKSSFPGC